MRVAPRLGEFFGKLLLQLWPQIMLQSFGWLVEVIQGEREVLSQVRFPETMPADQHLGETAATFR